MCPGKGPWQKSTLQEMTISTGCVLALLSWLRPLEVLMLYYSRDRDEIFVVNLVFQLSPNTCFTWKKRQILQSQTQQVSCSWTCSFEWSCKIAKKDPPTPPSRCALQRIRITFGKLPRWFAISWNWNRWERPVWLKIFLLRLLKRVNGNFWHWETPI